MATNTSAAPEGIDIASLMRGVASHAAKAVELEVTLSELASDKQDAFTSMMSAVFSGTDDRGDTVLSKETKLLGELEAQGKKSEFYSAIGMGGEGAAKISNQLATKYKESLTEALQLSDNIKQRESVGLTDNPLSHLWNQLVLPDEIAARDAALGVAKVASDGMATVNQMAQQTAKTEEEYAATLSRASVESQVNAVKANIDAKAAQVRVQSLATAAQDVQSVFAADGQRLQAISMGVQAKHSAASLAMAQASASREAVRFADWKEQKELGEQATADAVGYINLSLQAQGRPPIDNLKLATALKTRGIAGLPQELQARLENGFFMAGTGQQVYGGTLSKALEFSGITQTPVPTEVAHVYNAAVSLVTQDPNAPKNNKAAMQQAIDAKAQELLKMSAAKINSKDETNPLLIAGAKTISESAAVKQTKLYSAVLEPEITAGQLNTRDIGSIINKGLAAYQAGKISIKELGDGIETYLNVGINANIAKAQFDKYGLAAPITRPGGGFIYNAELTVPAEVARKPGDLTPIGNVFTGRTVMVANVADRATLDNILAKIIAVNIRNAGGPNILGAR